MVAEWVRVTIGQIGVEKGGGVVTQYATLTHRETNILTLQHIIDYIEWGAHIVPDLY